MVWIRSATVTPGSDHLLATAKFSADAAALPGESTDVNFLISPIHIFNRNPLWQENGVSMNASTGVYGSGAPVVVEIIPEPSTVLLVLTAVVGFGMYAWRRRKR